MDNIRPINLKSRQNPNFNYEYLPDLKTGQDRNPIAVLVSDINKYLNQIFDFNWLLPDPFFKLRSSFIAIRAVVSRGGRFCPKLARAVRTTLTLAYSMW